MKLCKGAIWPHRYNDISKNRQLQESNENLNLFWNPVTSVISQRKGRYTAKRQPFESDRFQVGAESSHTEI